MRAATPCSLTSRAASLTTAAYGAAAAAALVCGETDAAWQYPSQQVSSRGLLCFPCSWCCCCCECWLDQFSATLSLQQRVLRPVVTGTYVAPNAQRDALLDDPVCYIHAPRPQKIAMFCTGGIRCEKRPRRIASRSCRSTKSLHDVQVYHLEGGILAYLDTVPESQSKFVGECFVFDQRVAVTHGLRPTETYVACHACPHPVSRATVDSDPRFVYRTSCPQCHVAASENSPMVPHDGHLPSDTETVIPRIQSDGHNTTERRRFQRHAERQRQIELAAQQGAMRIHDAKQQLFVGVKTCTSSHLI